MIKTHKPFTCHLIKHASVLKNTDDGGIHSAEQGRFLEKVTRKGWHWSCASNIFNKDVPVASQAERRKWQKHGGVKGFRME